MVDFAQGSDEVRILHEEVCAVLIVVRDMDRGESNVGREIC